RHRRDRRRPHQRRGADALGAGPGHCAGLRIRQQRMKRDYLTLAFAMIFPSIMAWLYFVVLAVEGGRANEGLMFAFSIGKFVQFLFPAVYVWWFERERLRPTAPTRTGLAVSLLFGFGTAAAMFSLYFGWLKHSDLLGDT